MQRRIAPKGMTQKGMAWDPAAIIPRAAVSAYVSV
jgi:hypothetical protein